MESKRMKLLADAGGALFTIGLVIIFYGAYLQSNSFRPYGWGGGITFAVGVILIILHMGMNRWRSRALI